MKKIIVFNAVLLLFIMFAVSPANAQSSYAEDRAEIENLIARYSFALDFNDPDTYSSLFTENGVLDSGVGIKTGRKAIAGVISMMNQPGSTEVRRHIITNIVLKVEGEKAIGRAYWFSVSKKNSGDKPDFISFGHYEDEYVKVNGKWFFSKRKIYNENRPNRSAKGPNPAW